MTTTNSRQTASSPIVRRVLGISAAPEVEAPFRMWTEDSGVLFLSGGLDHDSVAEVRTTLRSCETTVRTIVDVSGLHFIDSSGLGCLLAQDDRIRREGGLLVLRGPGPNLRRVFEVTGATRRLSIEPADGG